MLSSVPSGTTSGRLPTCGAPRAGLSSTIRPTCQRLSPGQPTCEEGRKVDSHGAGAAGPGPNSPGSTASLESSGLDRRRCCSPARSWGRDRKTFAGSCRSGALRGLLLAGGRAFLPGLLWTSAPPRYPSPCRDLHHLPVKLWTHWIPQKCSLSSNPSSPLLPPQTNPFSPTQTPHLSASSSAALRPRPHLTHLHDPSQARPALQALAKGWEAPQRAPSAPTGGSWRAASSESWAQ